MPYWVLSVDEKGKPLFFGPYWTEIRAEAYKDKNCGRLARVTSRTKSRNRREAKKELEKLGELGELLKDRNAVLAHANR